MSFFVSNGSTLTFGPFQSSSDCLFLVALYEGVVLEELELDGAAAGGDGGGGVAHARRIAGRAGVEWMIDDG